MKRSLKDFLLTLVISIVIFAVVAFFLIRAAESLMGDVVGNVRSAGTGNKDVAVINETAEATPAGENPQPASQSLSMLFIILDDQGKADGIFLLGVNPEKQSATLAQIPANTGVAEVGVTYRLGDLYTARSVTAMERFVKEQVGIMPDYYVAVTRDGLSNWIDFIGGIPFTVPRDMEGFDPASNRKISLRAGNQKLTGDQAAQFLAFNGYDGGAAARDEALLSFARAFSNYFLQSPNLGTARAIYYNVAHHLNTNFEEKDFTTGGGVLFRFNEFTPNYVRIPGSTDANGYYSISTSRVQPMFEVYQ